MPCYTITEVKSDVGKWDINRWNRVQEATPQLRYMKYSNGQLISRGESNHTQLVQLAKQLYAKQTIVDASKRFGFRINSQSTTTNGHIQIKLSR